MYSLLGLDPIPAIDELVLVPAAKVDLMGEVQQNLAGAGWS